MDEHIEKVINNWDPINLLPVFPPDEYSKEIKEIKRILLNTKNPELLAEGIQKIFFEAFGDSFNRDIEECRRIAHEIMDQL